MDKTKSHIASYALMWAVCFLAFNAVVFLVRMFIPAYDNRYDAGFWVAWAFTLLAFAGNLACAWSTFKAEGAQAQFYGIPLMTVNSAGLIAMLVIGGVLMLIPNCPAWVVAIICIIDVAATAIVCLSARWAGNVVAAVDADVAQETQFMKQLALDSEVLLAKAPAPGARAAVSKVCEAIRYSDPASNDALLAIEQELLRKFLTLEDAVANGSAVEAAADDVLATLEVRNRICKAKKQLR